MLPGPGLGGAAGACGAATSFAQCRLQSDADGLQREAHPPAPRREDDSRCGAVPGAMEFNALENPGPCGACRGFASGARCRGCSAGRLSGSCVACWAGFGHFLWKAAPSAEIPPDLALVPLIRWHVAVLRGVPGAVCFRERHAGALGNARVFLLRMSSAANATQAISGVPLGTSSTTFSSPPTHVDLKAPQEQGGQGKPGTLLPAPSPNPLLSEL